ncbi:GtrA family protein [Vibrio gangliei]|uniref:GtrA family protein n=1 Tax=Vibrio gangliei TaxID=2077090 RepID=UPI000D01A71A|nr:GtrA family protein [Vibrio gangliei]
MPHSRVKMLPSFIHHDLGQKLRFGLVGLINTASAYLAFILIYQLSGRYLVASVLSYGIGMLISYVLNRSFVFQADKKTGQFIPFCLVNLTSLLCSTSVLYLLVEGFSMWVYLAQVLAVGVSMVVNYLGYRQVFSRGFSMSGFAAVFKQESRYFDVWALTQWLLFIILLAATLYNVQMSVFSDIAHDALPYMTGYSDKFVSEGRWINFALFYSLREMPSSLAVIICDTAIFYFGYKLALGIRKDTWFALCFGLLIVNVPYFTMLFKWPMTLVPGCVMLAFFAYVKDKFNPSAFLLVSGVLLFATYPAFYFLMPLLFLSTLRTASWREIASFVAVWILGYVLGYLVANSLVYAYSYFFSDHASFIQFAHWRRSTPSTDLASLMDNIAKSAANFERNALYISELSGWLYLPLACTVLWALKQHVKYCIVVLLVVFSIYASVLPLGVQVPLRSGITLPIGLAMVMLLVESNKWRTLLLVLLFIPLGYQMHDYNYGYTNTRQIMASIMEAHPGSENFEHPEKFDKVVISVDEPKMTAFMLQRTGSNAFKVPSNLRYHFIQPYLYKHGWPRSKIDIINDPRIEVNGDIKVKPEGRVLFVSLD